MAHRAGIVLRPINSRCQLPKFGEFSTTLPAFSREQGTISEADEGYHIPAFKDLSFCRGGATAGPPKKGHGTVRSQFHRNRTGSSSSRLRRTSPPVRCLRP